MDMDGQDRIWEVRSLFVLASRVGRVSIYPRIALGVWTQRLLWTAGIAPAIPAGTVLSRAHGEGRVCRRRCS